MRTGKLASKHAFKAGKKAFEDIVTKKATLKEAIKGRVQGAALTTGFKAINKSERSQRINTLYIRQRIRNLKDEKRFLPTVILVDFDMQECTLSNVDDMMRGIMMQRQIEGSSYTTVLPRLVNDSVIEFEINYAASYLELNKTVVEAKFRIKKENGTNLTVEDHLGTINYHITSNSPSTLVRIF